MTIVWVFFKPKHKSKIFLKCKRGEKKERNPNIYFLGKFKTGRPKAEGSRKRKAKDPNRPKRATSAYFFFLSKMREDSKKAGKPITKVSNVFNPTN